MIILGDSYVEEEICNIDEYIISVHSSCLEDEQGCHGQENVDSLNCKFDNKEKYYSAEHHKRLGSNKNVQNDENKAIDNTVHIIINMHDYDSKENPKDIHKVHNAEECYHSEEGDNCVHSRPIDLESSRKTFITETVPITGNKSGLLIKSNIHTVKKPGYLAKNKKVDSENPQKYKEVIGFTSGERITYIGDKSEGKELIEFSHIISSCDNMQKDEESGAKSELRLYNKGGKDGVTGGRKLTSKNMNSVHISQITHGENLEGNVEKADMKTEIPKMVGIFMVNTKRKK